MSTLSAARRRPTPRWQRPTAWVRDDGLATVWAATAVAVLAMVLVLGLHLAAAVLARHRGEAAADLAALAGAARAVEGAAVACDRARDVAEAGGAVLRRCALRGWMVLVEVETANPLPLPGATSATARAAAGP